MQQYKITRSDTGKRTRFFDDYAAALAEYHRLVDQGDDPTLWMSQWNMVDVPSPTPPTEG